MEKVVAPLCVMGLGLCFSLWGAISVKLIPRLGIDKGQFGSLISLFMGSCLVLSLIMGVVLDSVGYMPVAVFGFATVSCCLFLLAYARAYPVVLGVCMLLGAGAMALNAAGNTLATRVFFDGKNPAAASNLTNVFFGAGILLTPLTVSFLFRKTTYERTLAAMAIVVLLPVAAAVAASYPTSNAAFAFSDALGLLREPGLWMGGLVLFCCFSLDTTLKSWLPSLGKEVIGQAHPEREVGAVDASALRLLVWFGAGMMLSRFLASNVPFITERGVWFVSAAGVASGGRYPGPHQDGEFHAGSCSGGHGGVHLRPVLSHHPGRHLRQVSQGSPRQRVRNPLCHRPAWLCDHAQSDRESGQGLHGPEEPAAFAPPLRAPGDSGDRAGLDLDWRSPASRSAFHPNGASERRQDA